MRSINVFIDMDGVLAEYEKNVLDHMEKKGFFLNRPLMDKMLELVKLIVKNKKYEVYILSSVIDTVHCVPEKNIWLDTNLPEIKESNRTRLTSLLMTIQII